MTTRQQTRTGKVKQRLGGGPCSRCGGDLSRGYRVGRPPRGGLVCLCCTWLDEVERGQWAEPDA